jgi:hypothetical protein
MSSVRTYDNNTFINELSRLVGHSHLLTDPAKRPATARDFVPVRAMRWRWCSPARCWNCGVC